MSADTAARISQGAADNSLEPARYLGDSRLQKFKYVPAGDAGAERILRAVAAVFTAMTGRVTLRATQMPLREAGGITSFYAITATILAPGASFLATGIDYEAQGQETLLPAVSPFWAILTPADTLLITMGYGSQHADCLNLAAIS